jgi:hypothetical protein
VVVGKLLVAPTRPSTDFIFLYGLNMLGVLLNHVSLVWPLVLCAFHTTVLNHQLLKAEHRGEEKDLQPSNTEETTELY